MALLGVVWLVVAASVALVLWIGPKLERRCRTPKELRGDWWSAFEREFRAYVKRSPSTSRPPSTPRPSIRQNPWQRFDH